MRSTPKTWLLRIWRVLWDDARRFYTRRNLVRLVTGLLIGGILANTPLDPWLEKTYRQHLHSDAKAARNGQWLAKQFGDRRVVIVLPVAAMAVGAFAPPSPVTAAAGAWGSQMARALVVASPVTFGGTWLLGGCRPKDGQGSSWRPFQNKHAISGHAMAGALPFLVMAGMTANPAGQTMLYVCSGLTAFSRLDSQAHYPSQIFLGWWVAFLAFRTVRTGRRTSVDPNP